jgi:hypothetical protein
MFSTICRISVLLKFVNDRSEQLVFTDMEVKFQFSISIQFLHMEGFNLRAS